MRRFGSISDSHITRTPKLPPAMRPRAARISRNRTASAHIQVAWGGVLNPIEFLRIGDRAHGLVVAGIALYFALPAFKCPSEGI